MHANDRETPDTLDVEGLEKRYTPEPIPPCRVCGAPLGLASAGGGQATLYACNATGGNMEHYSRSRFQHLREGDSDVLALLSLIKTQEARIAELEAGLRPFLAADREALADHRPKWGIADCIDNNGAPYQSQFLADAITRARSLLSEPTVQSSKPSQSQPGSDGGRAAAGGLSSSVDWWSTPIATAYRDGWLDAINREPWDDMHDWLALTCSGYARAVQP